MTEKNILSVKNLSVELEGEKIIDDLSFDVKEGETFVILGPNGAGKTVLLKALLGLIPYQGEINWQSSGRIGYAPQRLPLIKDIPLSVEEFFKFKKISGKERAEILKEVGIDDTSVFKKRLGWLSSGQFQRILIAWALAGLPADEAGDCRVLLFDEPTAGVDIGGEETIYHLLHKIKKEKNLTVFLVSHDLSIVFKYATNILCLNKQKICWGSPKEALTTENLARLFGGEVKFYPHNHD